MCGRNTRLYCASSSLDWACTGRAAYSASRNTQAPMQTQTPGHSNRKLHTRGRVGLRVLLGASGADREVRGGYRTASS